MTLDLAASPGSRITGSAAGLVLRPRRLRRTPALRALVRESRLDPAMLVAPLFVRPGSGVREPIASMPGVARLSPDLAAEEAAHLAELGVGGSSSLACQMRRTRRAPRHRPTTGSSRMPSGGSDRSSCRS